NHVCGAQELSLWRSQWHDTPSSRRGFLSSVWLMSFSPLFICSWRTLLHLEQSCFQLSVFIYRLLMLVTLTDILVLQRLEPQGCEFKDPVSDEGHGGRYGGDFHVDLATEGLSDALMFYACLRYSHLHGFLTRYGTYPTTIARMCYDPDV
ncbi:hypothetical protein IRJ41_021656, partial [Triplophysa rosa]